MAENVLVQRAEFVRDVETSAYGVVEKPLTTSEKIFNNAAVRKGILLVLLATIWQVYASALENPLLFPKFSDTTRNAAAQASTSRTPSSRYGMLRRRPVPRSRETGFLPSATQEP